MVFSILFVFLSLVCFLLGTNNYGFNLLRFFFQNVNWDYYSPATLRNLAYYFSFVFCFLAFSSYKYEHLKGNSILRKVGSVYLNIKLMFFNKMKNLSFSFTLHTLTLVLIILLGLLARAYKMPLPILYDEAATYLDYCDGGFTSFLKIWNVNNHLTNTLLMKVSIEIFGNSPPALRLPSFVFGFVNLLLIYYISNQLHGKLTALISTFLYSCTPVLIHFESQARGYSIKVTFTLLLFIACFHFLQKPSKTYLFIISFISSLGFLTIFSFIFPFFGSLIWIVYELYKKNKFEKKIIANYIFLIIVYTKIISIFFYTPSIILSNGIYNILKISRAGNMNVYGSFPVDIPNFFAEFLDMLFFNNVPLTIIIFCFLGYTFLKENQLTSLMFSQFVSAAIIIIALSAIFPSRVFIYIIPFIILSVSVLISKIFLSIKSGYYFILPILQILIYTYFIENKVVDHYHGFIDSGMTDIVEKLKTLPSPPFNSKILLTAHMGFYKSFKYYHRINNLPTIEMYNDNDDSKSIGISNQALYIISSKHENIIDENLTKIFETNEFEIYRSNTFQ